jgi:hypothetical protein
VATNMTSLMKLRLKNLDISRILRKLAVYTDKNRYRPDRVADAHSGSHCWRRN